jgi:hypothetical protein
MVGCGVNQTIPHLLQTLTLRHSVQHISNDASLAVIARPGASRTQGEQRRARMIEAKVDFGGTAVISHLLAQELKLVVSLIIKRTPHLMLF